LEFSFSSSVKYSIYETGTYLGGKGFYWNGSSWIELAGADLPLRMYVCENIDGLYIKGKGEGTYNDGIAIRAWLGGFQSYPPFIDYFYSIAPKDFLASLNLIYG